MTHTERDEARAARADAPTIGRHEAALMRGYDPDRIDTQPGPALPDDDPWMQALAAAAAEAARLKKEWA